MSSAISSYLPQCCRENAAEIAHAFATYWQTEVHLHCGELQSFDTTQLPSDAVTAITLDDPGPGIVIVLPPEQPAGRKLGLATVQRIYELAESLQELLAPQSNGWSQLRVGSVASTRQALASLGDVSWLSCLPLRLRRNAKVVRVPILLPIDDPNRLFLRHAPRSNQRDSLPLRFDASVVISQRRVSLDQLARLHVGALLEVAPVAEQATLRIAGVSLAAGEAVAVGDRFGLRVQETPPPKRHVLHRQP